MRLIDADKFLAYLIYSKHIDGLTCGEVKEAIEMCKVDVPSVKPQVPTDTWSIKDVADTLAKHGLILEQEPREVLYSGDGYADGEMVYDMAECPNCGREFEDSDEIWNCNFCPDCGQALKWEGEEK